MTKIAVILLCLTAALALGACGKRGPLKPPPGEEEAYSYPQPYPSPRTQVPGGGVEPPEEESAAVDSTRRTTTTTTTTQ